MGGEEIIYSSYCPECDTEREVYRTVEWQSDTCKECGTDIE